MLSLADEVLRHKVLRIPEEVYGPPKSASTPADGVVRGGPRDDGRQQRDDRRQHHPRPRDPLHRRRRRQGVLRCRGEPAVAEPQDPGVGGADLASSTWSAGGRWPRTSPSRSGRARGSWSPAASSSAPGRPRTARSAASSRSSPTRSARACAGRPRRSPRTTGAAAAAVRRRRWRRRCRWSQWWRRWRRRAPRRPRPAAIERRLRRLRRRALLGTPSTELRRTTGTGHEGDEATHHGETEDPPQGRRGGAQTEEESVDPRQRADHVDRLQGRQPAAALHVGAGQDPRPPCHGQRLPAAARGRPGDPGRARDGAAALQRASGDAPQQGQGPRRPRRRRDDRRDLAADARAGRGPRARWSSEELGDETRRGARGRVAVGDAEGVAGRRSTTTVDVDEETT